MQTLKDVLLDRCPACRQVAVSRTLFRMYDRCPACGLQFEREPGYFSGAILFAWLLVCAAALPVWLAVVAVAAAPWHWTIPIVAAEIFILLPLVFRYSRSLWMYFDLWIDPPVNDGERDISFRHRY